MQRGRLVERSRMRARKRRINGDVRFRLGDAVIAHPPPIPPYGIRIKRETNHGYYGERDTYRRTPCDLAQPYDNANTGKSRCYQYHGQHAYAVIYRAETGDVIVSFQHHGADRDRRGGDGYARRKDKRFFRAFFHDTVHIREITATSLAARMNMTMRKITGSDTDIIESIKPG